mmetsp:Transcript_32670/g.83469  ORF Transcript_32670/g.83469 Transcript_32670/m.83469 type:complete len:332 (+) Transcript_32670:124-1119(+)
MLLFNVSITPKAGGKLGTLKHLDTQNPVMYMDFPEGRLKFFGTLVFPNTKYMMLKVGTKDILCEDIFGSMVVFSEVWWVGSAEENPEERRLDMPAALLERRVHQEPAEGPESQDPAGKMEEDAEEAEEDDDDKMQPPPPRPSSKPMRAAAKGALKVLRGEDSDDLSAQLAGGDEDSDGESYDGVGVLGKRSSQDTGVGSSGAGKPPPPKGSIQSMIAKMKAPAAAKGSGAGGETGKATPRGQAAAKGAPSTVKKAGSGGRKRKAASESDDEEVVEEDELEDAGVAATQGSQPRSSDRPQRRAAAKQVKYDLGSDDDDDEEEEEEEEDASSE